MNFERQQTMRTSAHAAGRDGNILLLMIGIITVMLVFAFGFLRSMQMARGTSQTQRQQKLAALAAEMGMQHAIAVSLHEYAMANEKRDGASVPAVSRIDSPSKNVFNMLSPRLSTQRTEQQPPTPWDLPPDVSFNDLSSYFRGTYFFAPSYNTTTSRTWITGYQDGWTMNRGYARYIEANRFDYERNQEYDPSTYSSYDLSSLQSTPPVMPNPAVVASPFRPVDPFVRGRPIIRRHDLDNPLWLDAEYRPVSMTDAVDAVSGTGAALARYRLRYAVCGYDMSPVLWMNTDPSWATDNRKPVLRQAYKEAIYAVAEQFGWVIEHSGAWVPYGYGTAMESIFLGYGLYANSRFDGTTGIPKDWAGRGGGNMYYRSPQSNASSSATRAFSNVHGSPFMNWNDGGSWKGAALTSWNDLGFALTNPNEAIQDWGENKSRGFSMGWFPMRADPVPHFVTTPFGRPYEAVTDHPWQVNALGVPMRILDAMISAYMPPVARTTFGVNSDPIAGVDLFTAAFTPGGAAPFADHTVPADRDYWTSPSRTNHTQPSDVRTRSQRYPGERFFNIAKSTPLPEVYMEPDGQLGTRWKSVTSDPRVVESNPSTETYVATSVRPRAQQPGVDHLGRHIVFYSPSANATARKSLPAGAGGNTNGYYSAVWMDSSALGEWKIRPWAIEFSPISPFTMDNHVAVGSTKAPDRGEGRQSFFPYARHDQKPQYSRAAFTNSYWNRVSVAFAHAVVVAQIANLSHTDPVDARNPAFWPASGYVNPTGAYDQNNDAAGIIYSTQPRSSRTVTTGQRKGPMTSWDPAAAHFAKLEHIDRQFLANLGESFDNPGVKRTSQVRLEVDPTIGATRPPRFSRLTSHESLTGYVNDQYADPVVSTFGYGSYLWVGEYHVTNNIRSLLLPCDANFVAPAAPVPPATATLFATCNLDVPARGVTSLADPPPRGVWLLDEWNALEQAGYDPANATENLRLTGTGPYAPTVLARTRAKLMERVLNDWRMSFLGAAKGYADDFRPKDFDGDGLVFCSGYLGNASLEPDTQLKCWQTAGADGNGPGNGRKPGDPAYVDAATADPAKKLTIFSVTGCLAFTRSHQYKIKVRGELFDNVVGRPVAEKYLEAALLVDPDNNIVRSANPAVLPTGLNDSTIIMRRPIHNYYRGYLSDTYP
ncbi:MAG: hypothetical protein J0M02_03060 [Planctomycetes bacterium]|nr:hypothetical protein [Planctomycetota bacterium]